MWRNGKNKFPLKIFMMSLIWPNTTNCVMAPNALSSFISTKENQVRSLKNLLCFLLEVCMGISILGHMLYSMVINISKPIISCIFLLSTLQALTFQAGRPIPAKKIPIEISLSMATLIAIAPMLLSFLTTSSENTPLI